MKRLFIAFALIGLSGCDNASDQDSIPSADSKPSISSMIANGTEELTSECTKGEVSLDCEFLSGDLLGSGKWHHAKVFISKQGKVDVTIDNERFYQIEASSGFYQGENVGKFRFKGLNNSIAEVTIRNSNSESKISLDAWNTDSKKFMIASY
ncbi:hypothetical protein M2371_001961 [Buttiauxella sp. BIGb0471]|uniref:hypothetical protein n=1 Tax=Buttiauxella sp. BIGb0471 TaxID=2940597 RepID=UPI00216A00C0|nr:hypothetical protein [Buttiauxella sp. BIGb0471]MCS3602752.1 hypothetical protein [Buttiauxella sp. BIGb0471]